MSDAEDEYADAQKSRGQKGGRKDQRPGHTLSDAAQMPCRLSLSRGPPTAHVDSISVTEMWTGGDREKQIAPQSTNLEGKRIDSTTDTDTTVPHELHTRLEKAYDNAATPLKTHPHTRPRTHSTHRCTRRHSCEHRPRGFQPSSTSADTTTKEKTYLQVQKERVFARRVPSV